jgi:hypothetical protein
MRGLLMALFAVDFPGHGASVSGRRFGLSSLPTKTTAKKTTATTV